MFDEPGTLYVWAFTSPCDHHSPPATEEESERLLEAAEADLHAYRLDLLAEEFVANGGDARPVSL